MPDKDFKETVIRILPKLERYLGKTSTKRKCKKEPNKPEEYNK